jgi:hypothetical protein
VDLAREAFAAVGGLATMTEILDIAVLALKALVAATALFALGVFVGDQLQRIGGDYPTPERDE